MVAFGWDTPLTINGYMVNSYDYPGSKATYELVDPIHSGCAEDGGRVLQQEFEAEAEEH